MFTVCMHGRLSNKRAHHGICKIRNYQMAHWLMRSGHCFQP